MRYFQYILTGIICTGLFSCSSTRKVKVKDAPFTTTQSGISYKILKDAKGEQYAKEGDYVSVHIKTIFEDSLIFSSKKDRGGEPVTFPVALPRFNGDLSEALTLLTPGDSAIFLVPVDTLRANKQTMQPWMKDGKSIIYAIEMVSIKTAEEVAKEREAKAKEGSNTQEDDEKLIKYFKKNKLNPQRTSSGLYYMITETTDNEQPLSGQTVTVNYTGKLMDGTVFDSNQLPEFNHVQPFSFKLGRGQVIRGWDEGIALLKKGEKATLFIPSYLAYGDRSPSPKIPPHSILIFEVELVDF
ncbi:MAG TPA: FKBP-type peptidyl-prolyl cis-trans isomerase [Flavipsychrobacter sp.]